MKCPNSKHVGYNIDSLVLSFVETNCSQRFSVYIEIIRKVIVLGPQAWQCLLQRGFLCPYVGGSLII